MRINLCYHVSSNRYLCNLNRNEEYRKKPYKFKTSTAVQKIATIASTTMVKCQGS